MQNQQKVKTTMNQTWAVLLCSWQHPALLLRSPARFLGCPDLFLGCPALFLGCPALFLSCPALSLVCLLCVCAGLLCFLPVLLCSRAVLLCPWTVLLYFLGCSSWLNSNLGPRENGSSQLLQPKSATKQLLGARM